MTMRDNIAAVIVEDRAVDNWENPMPSDYELAWCPPCTKFPDGRIMIWSGRLLFGATCYPTLDHLQYPATMWKPLVPPAVCKAMGL